MRVSNIVVTPLLSLVGLALCATPAAAFSMDDMGYVGNSLITLAYQGNVDYTNDAVIITGLKSMDLNSNHFLDPFANVSLAAPEEMVSGCKFDLDTFVDSKFVNYLSFFQQSAALKTKNLGLIFKQALNAFAFISDPINYIPREMLNQTFLIKSDGGETTKVQFHDIWSPSVFDIMKDIYGEKALNRTLHNLNFSNVRKGRKQWNRQIGPLQLLNFAEEVKKKVCKKAMDYNGNTLDYSYVSDAASFVSTMLVQPLLQMIGFLEYVSITKRAIYANNIAFP